MRGSHKVKVGLLVAAFGALAADRLLLGGGFGPASALAESLSLGGSQSVDVDELLADLGTVQALADSSGRSERLDGEIADAFAAGDRLLAMLATPREEVEAAPQGSYSVEFASVMLGRDPIAMIDGDARRVGDVLENGLIVVRIEQGRVVLSDGGGLFSVLVGTSVVTPVE